jgi:hypothetical protein
MSRRIVLLVSIVLVFAAGAGAQTIIKFVSTRVVGSRMVFGMNNERTPMQAHYILDEASDGTTVCTRVLFHTSGQFAAQEMPAEFCQ